MKAAISRLEQRALASGRMHEPITVDVNRARTVANITVPIEARAPTPYPTRRWPPCATRSCRRPSARFPDAEAGVTGLTAQWKDATTS